MVWGICKGVRGFLDDTWELIRMCLWGLMKGYGGYGLWCCFWWLMDSDL